MKSLHRCLRGVAVFGVAAGCGGGWAGAEAPVHFSREILPILSDRCFECHGPDPASRKAGLRLDVQEGALGALPSGSVAVSPGDRSASALFQRISAADPADRMPPADHPKQLSDSEVALIARWIDEGAPWGAHWAFVPPAPVEPPTAAGAAHPIDGFIATRLAEEGLASNREADLRTLARRVTLDLTGLPPTPEEVEEFVADRAPDAYARLVERLLASPRYGEHQARHWLDAARYSDTNGYHIDNARDMWPWRDWVIRAFNENLPFDEFTLAQLAGDLLPNATRDQRIASGFNRNHMINFEGGIVDEEYRVAYVLDRTNTTGTVWLGLSVGCAQCHDHKYDPISQKEYFQLYSFFNTVDEKGIDGREGNAAPMMPVPSPEQESRMAEIDARLAALDAELAGPMPAVEAAQAVWEQREGVAARERWTAPSAAEAAAQSGADLLALYDGSWLASGVNPDQDVYELVLRTDLDRVRALRLEALADPTLSGGSNGRSENGNFVLTGVEIEAAPAAAPEDWQRVAIALAEADYAQPDFPVANAIDGNPATGWASHGHARAEDRTAVFPLADPVGFGGGTLLRVRLRHEGNFPRHTMGRFRLSLSGSEMIGPVRLDPWMHNGPYTAVDGKTAFETAFGPEEAVDLEAAYPDGRMQWVARPDYVDGAVHDLPGTVCANYLYRTIHAPSARDVILGIGSNDAVRVWLNGRIVLDQHVQRGAAPDQDTVTVTLEPGENHLLMKVTDYGNAHQFFFRVKEQQWLPAPIPIEALLAKSDEARSDADRAGLRDYYRRTLSAEWKALQAKRGATVEEKQALEREIPTTMVMAEMREPRETFVLIRGEYDQPGEKVEPATPAALHPFPADAPRDRLGLAQWIVSPENPLTARVTVNRVWQQLFGRGLVHTTEDFGTQGAWPSHPELLDWLAADFVESGWDVKRLMRTIVTSAAYRRHAGASPALLERDPANALLARGPRFRLDAEALRDNALAVSGLLVEKVGGPSVNPYGPAVTWKEVSYGAGYSAQEFVQGTGEELYRRSLYTFWKRQAPPANMVLFDAPNREACTVRRSRSNTPLQALGLMNDPQYVEAARALAERVLREAGADLDARLDRAFALATARTPNTRERGVLRGVFEAQLAAYHADVDAARALIAVGESTPDPALDPVELAAWSSVASILLNLDETITKG